MLLSSSTVSHYLPGHAFSFLLVRFCRELLLGLQPPSSRSASSSFSSSDFLEIYHSSSSSTFRFFSLTLSLFSQCHALSEALLAAVCIIFPAFFLPPGHSERQHKKAEQVRHADVRVFLHALFPYYNHSFHQPQSSHTRHTHA